MMVTVHMLPEAHDREWRPMYEGKSLAQRKFDGDMAEMEVDDLIVECFGYNAEDNHFHYTTDYYDGSIEVYGVGIEATDRVLDLLAEAGFSLAWIHPHERGAPGGDQRGCPCPACPCHGLAERRKS